MRTAEQVARELFAELKAAGLGASQWESLESSKQEAWLTAIRKTGVGVPVCIKSGYGMDLAESSFIWARSVLGGVPAGDCTVIHTTPCAAAARELRDKWGCHTAEVPSDMMRVRFGWAVASPSGTAWSEPID